MGKEILRLNKQFEIDHNKLLQELETYRTEHGFSKQAMARKIGLRSYVSMYYWYKGITSPYPRNMFRIIQILGKPITRHQLNNWYLRIDKQRRYKECPKTSK